MNRIIIKIIISAVIPIVSSEFHSADFPKILKDCYNDLSGKFDHQENPGGPASIICINQYSWWTDNAQTQPDVHPNSLEYVRELAFIGHNRRKKRATGKRRIRKEIRMLTKKELKKFFKALKSLKRKKVPGTNDTVCLYDAIAGIHNGRIARSAHSGPNFLSWHRIYLNVFEEALHQVEPGVIFPYWDCTLEAGLENPGLSKLFTKKILGNADGRVKNTKYGKAKEWNLVRNIKSGGPLPGRKRILNILSRKHVKEIVVPFSRPPYNLEYVHNGIHNYIGGHLSSLEKASYDPIFFLLHCFIDYIFEKFRQQQKANGIDPEKDYPDPGAKHLQGKHRPNEPMLPFTNYSNIDGFLNYWTDEVYTYEDSPTECDSDCGSPWFSCINGLCYPKQHKGPITPKRSQSSDKQKERKRRAIKRTKRSTVASTPQSTCTGIHCTGSEAPMQNIFSINGRAGDVNEWVFIAVKVTFFRPQNIRFDTFEMHNNSFEVDHDIFDPSVSQNLINSMHVGSQGTYGSCTVNSGGAGKVFVRSDGLNYFGYSMEYTHVDERYPVSDGVAYVPVKDPETSPSEISLIAYDECGRACLPTCLVKNSNPPKYVPCTGCIKLDNSYPKRYGKTVPDLIYNMWHFREGRDRECPTPEYADIYVNFLCDSSNQYPWERI